MPSNAKTKPHVSNPKKRPIAGRQRGLSRLLALTALACCAQLGFADARFVETWGPNIGTQVPLLEANDQDGIKQTLDTLKGSNGLLFVFNRSVDW